MSVDLSGVEAVMPCLHRDELVFLDGGHVECGLKNKVTELEEHAFKLSAGMCVHPGGVVGGDGGTPLCPIQSDLETAQAEVTSLRNVLRAIVNDFMSPDEIRGECERSESMYYYGLDKFEALSMAYENMKQLATLALGSNKET